jgi:hypothetical protein
LLADHPALAVGYAAPMQSKAKTVSDYLASLPADRRAALEAVRKVIRRNIDPTYEESMGYGMMGWAVPHSVYPAGYHCDPAQPLPFAGLASQKQYMSLYLMCIYYKSGDESWFREAWARTGKKLDMGKCCVRFKSVDDLALDVIGAAIKRMPARKYIALYESTRREAGSGKATRRSKPAAKPKSTRKSPRRAPRRSRTS